LEQRSQLPIDQRDNRRNCLQPKRLNNPWGGVDVQPSQQELAFGCIRNLDQDVGQLLAGRNAR
jgi:hypothetical protein